MNWLAELGIILFAFNALAGPWVAAILGVLYLLWGAIKTITAYSMAKKIYLEIKGCCNGNKRNKK